MKYDLNSFLTHFNYATVYVSTVYDTERVDMIVVIEDNEAYRYEILDTELYEIKNDEDLAFIISMLCCNYIYEIKSMKYRDDDDRLEIEVVVTD